MYLVGFDPGGEDAFGWAVVQAAEGRLDLVAGGTCTGAPRALEAAAAVLPELPAAFGVDAPMYWVSSGDRYSDSSVRSLVCRAGGQSGTVSHVNSLRGACLVQGILIARMAHERWPSAEITEAHPKALALVFEPARCWVESLSLDPLHEHVRDAALAAYAASALVGRRSDWHDLLDGERSPFFPIGERVTYFFPRENCRL